MRGELLKTGTLAEDDRQFLTLTHRSDMTGPDRTWAAMYKAGDVVQYERGSKAEGIECGSFAVVRSSDGPTNRLTVELGNGSTVAYDRRRIYGVNVLRETSREFATGDRLQFSALNKEQGIWNRDMGTITKMEPDCLTVLMDGKEKRSVSFDPKDFRQFDHGYAVTSHSAQGLTTERVIANIDTDSSRSLINTRLAYVAISRASEDARIYTNNAETLGQRLATDVTKTAALDFKSRTEPPEAQFSKVPEAPPSTSTTTRTRGLRRSPLTTPPDRSAALWLRPTVPSGRSDAARPRRPLQQGSARARCPRRAGPGRERSRQPQESGGLRAG